MENGPFIDGLPSYKMVIFHGYVSHNQMVRQKMNDAGHSEKTEKPTRQLNDQLVENHHDLREHTLGEAQ